MNKDKDQYFVAVKTLMRQGEKMLITHDIFGSWDIPGGRIKPDEFETPLEDIVTRKIVEELGQSFEYKLGKVAVFFRHQRIEHSTRQPVRIFAVGYEAEYISGDIELGENHDEYKWIDLRSFNPTEYFEGGWLRGIEEYQDLIKDRA
jgi:8-oxo-dGTP pyrophosphatase MutT (NUDIX family)